MALKSTALVQLDSAKMYLDVKDTERDKVVELLVNGVSDLFNTKARRTLAKTTYTNVYLDGPEHASRELWLPQYPIVSVTSLYENDVLLVEGTDFYVYPDEGYLYRISGTWPVDAHSIKLTYVAGYDCTETATDTLPQDLRLACLKQLAFEWNKWKSKSFGETARSYKDGNISYVETDELLKEVEAVILKYRNESI